MTMKDLNTYRQLLDKAQTQAGRESGHLEALAIDSSPDELDRIQQANDRHQAISSLERNSSRLREIRSALRRIQKGQFGLCAGCEEAISPRRLAAVPWAAFCIQCQEISEREQESNGHEIAALEMAL